MAIAIYEQIENLLAYGIARRLLMDEDVDYARNLLLNELGLDAPVLVDHLPEADESLPDILATLLDWAADNGLLEANTVTYRDLFDTKLMNALLPRPSTVIQAFYATYKAKGAKAATAEFFEFNQSSHYIRTDRIALNESWTVPTHYGDLEMTINLSKPEIDPTAIAAAKNEPASTYPNGLLAKENVGFAGRAGHPARQNLRIIPVTLCGQQWYFQFSPYVYYHEHAIVFAGKQVPMEITPNTFSRLLEFIDQFPHYFIGSNADLPIVGGSILNHDHYQAGMHSFPMAKAPIKRSIVLKSHPSIQVGLVAWPMSVIRLQGTHLNEVQQVASTILSAWRVYNDESLEIFAKTGGELHNTITPVARRRGGAYELDLVLRNNRTTAEHPLGLFHPHAEVHPIKKENIGLIEVMGLAILPGRLKTELQEIARILPEDDAAAQLAASETVKKHEQWALALKQKKQKELTVENATSILKAEVGQMFLTVLSHAGVFKGNAAGEAGFIRFLHHIEDH